MLLAGPLKQRRSNFRRHGRVSIVAIARAGVLGLAAPQGASFCPPFPCTRPMRIPKSLEQLADDGVIDEVLRPLLSGKEAQISLVVAGGKYCAAKIYKDAQTRSFKNRADYVEG